MVNTMLKLDIVKKISPEIALEVMNALVSIHNNLVCENEKAQLMAFFEMGVIVEQLAARIRSET